MLLLIVAVHLRRFDAQHSCRCISITRFCACTPSRDMQLLRLPWLSAHNHKAERALKEAHKMLLHSPNENFRLRLLQALILFVFVSVVGPRGPMRRVPRYPAR